MTISEILERWPETIPVFIQHRMACVGCSMADFMTLEDALDIYKIKEELFIEELFQAIQNRQSEAD
jgi:hybrid cluster-associated redox disulfide protein